MDLLRQVLREMLCDGTLEVSLPLASASQKTATKVLAWSTAEANRDEFQSFATSLWSLWTRHSQAPCLPTNRRLYERRCGGCITQLGLQVHFEACGQSFPMFNDNTAQTEQQVQNKSDIAKEHSKVTMMDGD